MAKAKSTNEDRRRRIFDRYSNNLKTLVDQNIIKWDCSAELTYICPICLKHFVKIEDDENPLTLEDAPQKSLGGKANILTCKVCNNTCGRTIDYHLTERLNELDTAKFIPGTEVKIRTKYGNDTVQGTLKVGEDGVFEIIHSNINNDPRKLEEHVPNLKKGNIVTAEFIKSRVIPENLEYALLKTGYLLAFQKFGYSLILDDCYNVIRTQLLKPEKRVYPDGFWFTPPFEIIKNDVFFILNEGLESLLAFFKTRTAHTSRTFGTILPLPIRNISETINNINLEFDKNNGQFILSLYPKTSDNLDYLNDLKNIQKMKSWITEKKQS